MSTSTQLTRILQRGRTASAWAALNEILLDREIGVITDSVPRQFKIGDGVTHWNDLALAFDNTGTANAAPGDTPSSSYKTYNVATAGTYTNFGGLVVSSGDLSSGLVQLRLNGSTWSKVIIPISLTAYAQKVDAILKADAINTDRKSVV